ncbi:MAG: S8 family serine peptidase [Acetobacteraceae bacterium]|nr:S8 family serine peptidase [Acetobacteraceae bacterium]
MSFNGRPNDPLFRFQWFLENTGQAGGGVGNDIGILRAWPSYTGQGVRVGVVDDGTQLDHPDFAGRVDVAQSWDAALNQPGGNPVAPSQNHGTAVAGTIVAGANDGIGGAGVAPGATLVAYRVPLGPGQTRTEFNPFAVAFDRLIGANVQVVNNSWGTSIAFVNDVLRPNEPGEANYFAELAQFGREGRGGLGGVILFASGNERAEGADGGLNNVTGSRYVITVGALDNNGEATAYSTPGSNLLISAPAGASTGQSSRQPGTGITTTDRTGEAGYNATPGEAGNHTYGFDGTSVATPIVSGVTALMLQANSGLGYRDVHELLIHSARQTDLSNVLWAANASDGFNGGGMFHSRLQGFGMVDAGAAVRLAEANDMLRLAPKTDANLLTQSVTAPAGSIPVGPGASGTLSFTVPTDMRVERVELQLDITAANVTGMSASLTSARGSSITMFENPRNAALIQLDGPSPSITPIPWPEDGFILSTPGFWGERAAGTWQFELTTGALPATITGATLRLFGSPATADNRYIFTDQFAFYGGSPARRTLDDAAGINTLDASAVSQAIRVEMSLAGPTVIAGHTLQIAPGTLLHNALGGDGNDLLLGNDFANVIGGGRGSDTINGGLGRDTAAFAFSREAYSVLVGASGAATVRTRDGSETDTLANMEALRFDGMEGALRSLSDVGLTVAGFYAGLLGRAPDAGGFKGWTDAGIGGLSTTEIGARIAASPEFQAGRAMLTTGSFVDQLYDLLLGRAPDAGGYASWTGALSTGALTRSQAVQGFFDSSEFQANRLDDVAAVVNTLGDLWA